MILDNGLAFVSSPQTITSTAASTNIIDLTGFGSGVAPNLNFGNASTYGADMSIGDGEAIPTVAITISTTFTTSNSATLTIQLQGAPDNGSNAPGSYTTYAEIPTLGTSTLIASATTPRAQAILGMRWPKVPYGIAYPRFWRLNWQVNVGTFSAGAIGFAGITLQRDDSYAMSQYPANYTVAA